MGNLTERASKAKAIWTNRLGIAIMIACIGLAGICFGKAITLTPYGSLPWVLLWVIMGLLVVLQVCLAGLLWWARKVVNSGQGKL